MTFPAARIGDMTAHGGTIVVGFPTVLIGGKPAARIGDNHVCPMVTGIVPHVGGPIILGAFNVLVGGVPQARVSDMAVCVGPPDTITIGESTVLVGTAAGGGGAMGAVLGGMGAGLMNFFSDGPKAELQPDGSVVTQVNDAINIEGTPEFQATVLERLNLIEGTKSGQAMLKNVANSGKQMKITEFTGNNSFASPSPNTNSGFADGTPNGQSVFYGDGSAANDSTGSQLIGSGKGTDVEVQFNPNLNLPNPTPGADSMPNDAVLFHEMNHGSNFMNGKYDGTPQTGGWTTQEEKNTIAAGNPSEADYLKERGYPYKRTSHDTTYAPH